GQPPGPAPRGRQVADAEAGVDAGDEGVGELVHARGRRRYRGQHLDPPPRGGGGGEAVPGPAVRAGEGVEGGREGEGVAGAPGQLDRARGGGEGLDDRVVGRALVGAEGVGEYRGLGQHYRGLGGRVGAGQLAGLAQQRGRLALRRDAGERAREAVG